jgi:hypothetical protein
MKSRIKMNGTWIVIIVVGVIFFIYGFYFHDFFWEALGALSSVGALFSGLSGMLIRVIRRKHGQRYK